LDPDIAKTVGSDLDMVLAGRDVVEAECPNSIGLNFDRRTLLVNLEHDMSPDNGGSGGVQHNSGKPGKGLALVCLTPEKERMDEADKDQQSWKETSQAKILQMSNIGSVCQHTAGTSKSPESGAVTLDCYGLFPMVDRMGFGDP
jgi:hypothetical protein